MTIALPKVSIITPTYNYGHFIEDTIVSVLSQDYPNLEYIIVDGNSTDQTIDILKKYDSDSRLKWISEDDGGQSDALIKGFNLASGDIFAWLCSDDIYLPNAVSSIVSVMQKSRSEFVFGDAIHIDREGYFINYNTHPGYHPNQFKILLPICQPTSFWTKDLYFRSGGINKSYVQIMDRDLLWRMSKLTNFTHTRQFVCAVRIHEDTKTNRLFAQTQREETLRNEAQMSERIAPLYFAQYLKRYELYPKWLKILLRGLFSFYNTMVRAVYAPKFVLRRSIERAIWLFKSIPDKGRPLSDIVDKLD